MATTPPYPSDQHNAAAAIPVYVTGGSGGGGPTIPSLTDRGYQQIANPAVSTPLTVPGTATTAVIGVQDGNVRWRADGTPPTGDIGNIIWGTSQITVPKNSLAAIRFINMTGSNATLNVQYYG